MRLGLKAEYNWDQALEAEFPLAPRDLLEKGQVTEESYLKAERLLRRFVHLKMRNELLRLNNPGMVIEVLGPGLFRDLSWVPNAVRYGYKVAMTDISRVACILARGELRHKGVLRRVTIRQTSLEAAWESGQIDHDQTIAYYGGQFIQNQDEDTMVMMMEGLGRFLRLPGRVVWLLHPLGEENDPEEVRWRNTTPYFEKELREPLETGLGGPALMKVIGKHDYFDHQHYTLFRIKGA